MARIAGVNIPLNKRVEVGLTYVYGIGRPTSNRLLSQLEISPDTQVRNLTEDEVFFDLIDEMSPGVLKIQTPFLYVLMPMRVSS